MTRRLARLGAALCFLVGIAVAVAPPARAVLPDKVGWWNKLQQIPVLPGAGPVNLPLPPVVSSDDFPVANDGTPEGLLIGAIRYNVPPGASAKLTLVDTNDRPIVMPPGTSISACPTTRIWDGLINGNWSTRPTYDCAALSAVSSPTADGLGFSWDLPAAFQVSPGAIDIALVPSGNPLPFAAVFSGPTDASLVLTNVPDTPEETQAALDSAPALSYPTESSPSYDFGESLGGMPDIASPLTGVRPRRVLPAQRTNRFAPPGVPLPLADSRAERTLAFLLLAALGGGLFWFGGQPARAPRLLGSLGHDQPDGIAASAMAGVGRFARPRGGRD